MSLDQSPEVKQLASELKGDGWQVRPVQSVIAACKAKLQPWIRRHRPKTLAELENLVCIKLRLVVEEVWSDADFGTLIQKYKNLGEFGFVYPLSTFDDDTFAVLLERDNVDAGSPDRYVSVVDCRGGKASRRYFSRWHEIAHLLTLTRQLELPFHRSVQSEAPLEKIVDVVAGELGFYEPLVRPVLERHLPPDGLLSFDVVERVKDEACPEASFQSSLIACLKLVKKPAVLIDVGLGLKRSEQRARQSGPTLFPMPRSVPRLRAFSLVQNDAARQSGLRIDPNMAVPEESIVFQHFTANLGSSLGESAVARESLALWRHSNGIAVGEGLVQVEARRCGDVFYALVSRT